MIAAGWHPAVDGISRDIDELLAEGCFGVVVLTMVFGLPIASFAAILARRWLAVLPLLVSVALGFGLDRLLRDGLDRPAQWPGHALAVRPDTLSGWSVLMIAVSRRWQPPPVPTRPQ